MLFSFLILLIICNIELCIVIYNYYITGDITIFIEGGTNLSQRIYAYFISKSNCMQSSEEIPSKTFNLIFYKAIKEGLQNIVLVGGLQAIVVALGPPKVATMATYTGGKVLFGSTAVGLGAYEMLSVIP